MRTKTVINEGWVFSKECNFVPTVLPMDWEKIKIPHTWNSIDGQDGGSDYYRGTCCYARVIERQQKEDVIYLEFEAAANSATVYMNGEKIFYHEGGYSTFRVNITDYLKEKENLLVVAVDNSANDRIYPQTADFTFYGGLYRNVSLITVSNSHFDLDYYGGTGLKVSSDIKDQQAVVHIDAYITNPISEQTVEISIKDREGRICAAVNLPAKEQISAKLMIPNVHLWQGVEDPYLYTVDCFLVVHNEVVDQISTRHGVRTFTVDAQKGFFLNGKLTPLRGVSRHQDLLGVGNALTKEQHQRDMEFIKEIGANTIRLAHYQHSQDFYDACDEAGMIIWAEIPFISVMSKNPEAHQNCISQMRELITQNYNHTSICFWGISNEITIGGEREGLVENLKELNELVHKLDSTRLSTIAQVSLLSMDNKMNEITDVVSYNHYFGWYGGTLEQNEEWLDNFHEMHPNIPLGLSEYGAEGIITYHNDEPKVRDYSEDYQAIYHEHMAKIIENRPWLWATHVWNMFDFGCDARDEGGVKGRNNKGLMTLDRKVKKDSFYLYKAYWSKEKFVHLCGHRYAQRVGEETTIKVYSNLSEVKLYIDGELFESKSGYRVFVFKHVPISLKGTMIVAQADNKFDSMTIYQTEEQNETYILALEDDDESDGAANWFNLDDYKEVSTLEIKEGYFSIKDTIGDIIANEEAGTKLAQIMGVTTGMKIKASMLGMVKDMSVESIAAMGMSNQSKEGPDILLIINEVLNKIKK